MAYYDSSPPAYYDSGITYDSATPPVPLERKRMAQIAFALKKRNLDQKLQVSATLVSSMTDNDNFLTPNPPLSELTAKSAAIALKRTAIATAESDLAQLEEELETLEAEQDVLITSLGKYIENVAKGDAAKIASSGAPLKGERESIGQLSAPANLRATGGDLDGETDCMWDPVDGANTYIVECASNATGPWTQTYVGKKSRCTAAGLTSGQLYYFRVRAVGAAGPGPWSDIAHKRAT